MSNASLANRFASVVADAKDAVAIDRGRLGTTRYDTLWQQAGRMAGVLRDAGAQPGERVAVMVEKSVDALALYLACLRAGAIYLPLNPAYQDSEASFILRDARPAVVVASATRANRLRALARPAAQTLTLDAEQGGSLIAACRDQDQAFDDVARRNADPAAILYTSGTTGQPKGAMISHGNLSSNADALIAAWRFDKRDVLLHALPIFHVHGLFVALHCAFLVAARVRFLPRFDAGEVLRELPNATVFMGVPTYYTRLLAEPDLEAAAAASANLRLFTSGSAPLAPKTHRAFAQRTGHAILERYGMTEAGMIAANPYDGERVPGSVGFALPGVETRVAHENGAPCAAGEVGGLEVRGPNVFPGYWQRDDANAEAFRGDGFLITGDLARCDKNGRLFICGRAKDMVISGGLNVYPAEIEQALSALDGVAESAVIGVPHADFGEGVLAVVVRAPGHDDLEAATLRAALSKSLAAYKRPKRVVFVHRLPRNVMGKVQKAQLRARFRHALDATGGR